MPSIARRPAISLFGAMSYEMSAHWTLGEPIIILVRNKLLSVVLLAMASSRASSEHELWGWETFLKTVNFVRDSGRQLGNCCQDYARYVIERFEQCELNVSRLRDHIDTRAQSRTLPQESRDVLTYCFMSTVR